MAPPIPPEASKEIEFVKSLVALHFPVYDIRVTYDVVEFFCRVDTSTLEDEFEKMRLEMGEKGYIPMIVYDKGEHIVTVAKKPIAKYRSIYVNVALLLVTFFTVLLSGVIYWVGYDGLPTADLFSPEVILMGLLTFALPLMAILGVHELAHYFAARRRKVAASLPFFIFGPPPLGTFGAFISIRDPIPSKKALLEIGMAGPIAGLLLALPLTILGMTLTNSVANPAPVNVGSGGVININFSILTWLMSKFIPLEGSYLMHPLEFAAWVGLLVTALNLLPFGQLDGGHVSRALLGARSKYLGYVTIAVLVGIGMFYFGWLIFALFVFILGARHPPPLNDISPLGKKRVIAGILTLAILVVAFVPIPMESVAANYSFEFEPTGDTNATVAQGATYATTFGVVNTGNAYNLVQLSRDPTILDWNASFKLHSSQSYASELTVVLNSSQVATVDVLITTGFSLQVGNNYSLSVRGISLNATGTARELTYNVTITSPEFSYDVQLYNPTVVPGNSVYTNILFNNTGSTELNMTVLSASALPPFVDVILSSGGYNNTGAVNFILSPGSSWPIGVWILVSQYCPSGNKVVGIDVYNGEELLTTIPLSINVA